jgi:hypothetical protein
MLSRFDSSFKGKSNVAFAPSLIVVVGRVGGTVVRVSVR